MAGHDFLVDTNVLVYAFDLSEGEKHLVAKKLLGKCWVGELKLAVSIQNINEFCYVVSQKVSAPLSAGQVRDIVELVLQTFI
ncbi:PIN domain-containing protein [Candidatus Woesearchaeota archaeon]|nr:PIN domain-containing protein [Candidatus Woesearchaeota archaeon]